MVRGKEQRRALKHGALVLSGPLLAAALVVGAQAQTGTKAASADQKVALESQVSVSRQASDQTMLAPRAFRIAAMDAELALGEVSALPDIPITASFQFLEDFEGFDASATTIPGWSYYANAFLPSGAYLGGAGGSAPNGENISSIASDEAGAEQGSQYLSVFSNYNDGNNHNAGNTVETLVYREFAISASDVGTYSFSFDAKRPGLGAVAPPASANAFIKILDPNNGYSAVFNNTVDMTSISSSEWARFSLEVTVDGAVSAGQLIQFGFSNTATNFNPTAVFYDNIIIAEVTDSDGDGVADSIDAFPNNSSESVDTDGDGIGNNADTDDDNDGVLDTVDFAPEDASVQDAGQGRFSGLFGGVTLDNGVFTFPTGAASFAGFANENADLYPLTFEFGGEITFTASIPSDASADLYFRFERLPYDPNDASATEPSFNSVTTTVSGAAAKTYTISLAPQGSATFSSLLLYLVTQDVGVKISDIRIRANSDPSAAAPLAGTVYHWAQHTRLGGVSISRSQQGGASQEVTLSDGTFEFAETVAGSVDLSASISTSDLALGKVITSADALAALKISVGLNPNPDPDGSGPNAPLAISPYQLIAADINQDGRVTSADALAILKIAVGLNDALDPFWAFVADTVPVWESVDRNAVHDASTPVTFSYPNQTRADFVGILVGDVNGSWNLPVELPAAVDVDFLGERARTTGAPLSIWGVSDADSDGVADLVDQCEGTSAGINVDATGCPASQGVQLSERVMGEQLRVISAPGEAPLGESCVTDCVLQLDTGLNREQTGLSMQGAAVSPRLSVNASASVPLLLRGDMNDWGLDLPFTPAGDALRVSVRLEPGTYGFKIASPDWYAADLGPAASSMSLVGSDVASALAPSRDLLRFTADKAGEYLFELQRGNGSLHLTVVSADQ
jgi:hypothetical protein